MTESRPPGTDAPRHGLAPLATSLARTVGPLLKRRGFAQARIVTDWAAVVGEEMARRSMPERLVAARDAATGGTLFLRVAGGWALEAQHLAPQIVERVNRFYGYPAVARLKLVQGPLPMRPRDTAAKPLPPEQESNLAQAVAAIADDGLRDSLLRFGRAIRRRDSAMKAP
jgi:hypothetical protein